MKRDFNKAKYVERYANQYVEDIYKKVLSNFTTDDFKANLDVPRTDIKDFVVNVKVNKVSGEKVLQNFEDYMVYVGVSIEKSIFVDDQELHNDLHNTDNLDLHAFFINEISDYILNKVTAMIVEDFSI